MDEQVMRAMARWPHVPAVYGWLSLDRRGRWLIRGETISNRAALAFIGRNYAADERGRWYFQNGPQRVFVTLDYTPVVYFLVEGADRLLDLGSAKVACVEQRVTCAQVVQRALRDGRASGREPAARPGPGRSRGSRS